MSNKKHVHYDLIVAWAKGAKIQGRYLGGAGWADKTAPDWDPQWMYRIKPEPEPDQVIYAHVKQQGVRSAVVWTTSVHNWNLDGKPAYSQPVNAKIVFDGETGELKAIELVK